MATATITRDGKTSVDTRYFLSSVTDVERFAYAVRKHWAIENQLHWCLDVIFDEDSSRARKDMPEFVRMKILYSVPLAEFLEIAGRCLRVHNVSKAHITVGSGAA